MFKNISLLVDVEKFRNFETRLVKMLNFIFEVKSVNLHINID